MNTEKIKSALLKALNDAGKLLSETLHDRRVIEKKTELSIVTETDQKAEKIIIDLVKSAFPDHAILAEESLGSGDSPYRWIIDPIDGTTNFAHTFPASCVSIAFEDHGEVIMGGVFQPFDNELYFAEKGKGATLNEKPIKVSETSDLGEALLATGFPYDRKERVDEYLAIFKDFLMNIQGIRRLGSAAMDMCYVACGRFDGYWECSLMPWDIAAAALILEEAGGKLSDYSGGKFDINGFQYVASNGHLHDAMLEILKPHRHIQKK